MDPAERFATMVGGPPTPWTLDTACSLIAASFTRRDRAAEVMSGLDELAGYCTEPSLRGVLAAMRGRVRGNTDDYYDPRNSFIEDVLERGIGLPITLGVIAIEVARRVGAPVAGVGLPGHFMVRDVGHQVFGDPFHDGAIYDRAGLVAAWARLVGAERSFDDAFLLPMTERAILIRILNNLRALYVVRNDVYALHALGILRGSFFELVHEQAEHARWMRHWN